MCANFGSGSDGESAVGWHRLVAGKAGYILLGEPFRLKHMEKHMETHR